MTSPSEVPDIPTNMVEAMLWLKEWLDLTDKALLLLGTFTGLEPPEQSQDVQGDLLMWAEWFREHPMVDAQMFGVSSLACASGEGDG